MPLLSETRADIFAKPNITRLTLALAKEDCEILSVEERNESLESYFISAVGGDHHA